MTELDQDPSPSVLKAQNFHPTTYNSVEIVPPSCRSPRKIIVTWKAKGNSHLTHGDFPSPPPMWLWYLLLSMWFLRAWAMTGQWCWRLYWLSQHLSGTASLFSSLPLLSFRSQPLSVPFAQGTGGLPRYHRMTVHNVCGDSSHNVQYIFYCTKDQW